VLIAPLEFDSLALRQIRKKVNLTASAK